MGEGTGGQTSDADDVLSLDVGTVDEAVRLTFLTLSREVARPLVQAVERATPDPGPTGRPPRVRLAPVPSDVTWSRGMEAVAVLVVQHGGPDNEDHMVAGLALAETPRRGNNEPDRTMRFREVELVLPPIPVSTVVDALAPEDAEQLRQLRRRPAVPLSRSLTTSVLRALGRVRPELDRTIEEKYRNRRGPALDAATRDRRDRLATGVRFFGLDPARERPTVVRRPTGTARRATHIWERQMIKEDARSFPGWDRLDGPDDWWEFTRGDRRLLLRDVDADQGERATGGDLVYIRLDPDAVVLVQYKRADFREERADAYLRIEDRFAGQLDKLIALEELLAEGTPVGAAGFRLSPAPGYVKVIESRPKVRATGDVYQGYYFPARHLRNALAEHPGETVDIDVTHGRHIDSQTFVQLVSGGWIGSQGQLTDHLLEALEAQDVVAGARTVAVDSPVDP